MKLWKMYGDILYYIYFKLNKLFYSPYQNETLIYKYQDKMN